MKNWTVETGGVTWGPIQRWRFVRPITSSVLWDNNFCPSQEARYDVIHSNCGICQSFLFLSQLLINCLKKS